MPAVVFAALSATVHRRVVTHVTLHATMMARAVLAASTISAVPALHHRLAVENLLLLGIERRVERFHSIAAFVCAGLAFGAQSAHAVNALGGGEFLHLGAKLLAAFEGVCGGRDSLREACPGGLLRWLNLEFGFELSLAFGHELLHLGRVALVVAHAAMGLRRALWLSLAASSGRRRLGKGRGGTRRQQCSQQQGLEAGLKGVGHEGLLGKKARCTNRHRVEEKFARLV
jgi:hypothetical protein